MKKQIATLFFLLIAKTVVSQVIFKGKVVDQSGNPIENIKIEFSSENSKALSETDGNFSKRIINRSPEMQITITVAPQKGFEGYEKEIWLEHSYDKKRFTIVLRPPMRTGSEPNDNSKSKHGQHPKKESKPDISPKIKLKSDIDVKPIAKLPIDPLLKYHLSRLLNATENEKIDIIRNIGILKDPTNLALKSLDSIMFSQSSFDVKLETASAIYQINSQSESARISFILLLNDYRGKLLSNAIVKILSLKYFEKRFGSSLQKIISQEPEDYNDLEARVYASLLIEKVDSVIFKNMAGQIAKIMAKALTLNELESTKKFREIVDKVLTRLLPNLPELAPDLAYSISNSIVNWNRDDDAELIRLLIKHQDRTIFLKKYCSIIQADRVRIRENIKNNIKNDYGISESNEKIASFVALWMNENKNREDLISIVSQIHNSESSDTLLNVFSAHREVILPLLRDLQNEIVLKDIWTLSLLLKLDSTYYHKINIEHLFKIYKNPTPEDSTVLADVAQKYNTNGILNFFVLKKFILTKRPNNISSGPTKTHFANCLRKAVFDLDSIHNTIYESLSYTEDLTLLFSVIKKLDIRSNKKIAVKVLELVAVKDPDISFMSLDYLVTVDVDKIVDYPTDTLWLSTKRQVIDRIISSNESDKIRTHKIEAHERGTFLSGKELYILKAAQFLARAPWRCHTRSYPKMWDFSNHMTLFCKKNNLNCSILNKYLTTYERD